MSNEAVYDPPPAPDKSTDTVMSEERRLTENSILEELLRNGDITVKEEPLITPSLVPALDINVKREPGARTPSSSHCMKIEVIDLVDDDDDDDDDDDGGQDHDGDGMAMTSKPHHITDFFTIDRNPEAQHSSLKQPDDPNSVMDKASVHPSLRPAERNSGASVARQSDCCEPVQVRPHSRPSQTNIESNIVQEPRYLGPFVESSTIKCPKCSVVLTTFYEILLHSCIDQHISRESKKKRIKCCFCEKEYGTIHSLRKHIKTYVEKTYVKCSVCGKHLKSICSFKDHARTHTNKWPYRCDICGQGSRTEYQLELHKTIHTNEKLWMCDVCGATFPHHSRLRDHKTVHLEKNYECDLCFAKFRDRYRVKLHKKKVHSVRKEKFQCGHCSSAFTEKYFLRVHIEMKHDENSGGETFVCSMCNKELKHRFAFKKHMWKHKQRNENVVYTCDMCNRNFPRKGSLIRHISEHNGKQFNCSICGMLFTQQGSVKRHMLKLHPSDR